MEFINTKQACQILGVEEVTLTLWRYKKRGPDYFKIGGSVRYDRKDVEDYLKNSKVCLSKED